MDLRRHRPLALAALLLCAGCSGGTGSDPAASGPPPAESFDEERFKQEVDGICQRFNEQEPVDTDFTTLEEAQAGLAALRTSFNGVHDELSAVTYPPSEDGQRVREILVTGLGETRAEINGATDQFERAVAEQDQAAYAEAANRLLALEDGSPDKDGFLETYGLPECSTAFGA